MEQEPREPLLLLLNIFTSNPVVFFFYTTSLALSYDIGVSLSQVAQLQQQPGVNSDDPFFGRLHT